MKILSCITFTFILAFSSASHSAGDPNQLHAEGLKLFYAENYKGSIDKWEQELKFRPGNKEIMRDIGLAYERLNDLRSAKEWYYKALKIDPRYARVHNAMGIIFQCEKKYKESEKELLKVLELSPDYPMIHFNLGTVYGSQNKPAQAREEYFKDLGIANSESRAWSYNNLFMHTERLASNEQYVDAQNILLKLKNYKSPFEDYRKEVYNPDKKIREMYTEAILKGNYRKAVTGLEALPSNLRPNKDLNNFLKKSLAYCYLVLGDKEKTVKAMTAAAASSAGQDRKKLELLSSEIMPKKEPQVSSSNEPAPNSRLKVTEYDLGLPAKTSLADKLEGVQDYFKSKTWGARTWSLGRKNIDTEKLYLAKLRRGTSPSGFRLIDTSALKITDLQSHPYDLFKNGSLVAANLGRPYCFSSEKGRFIFLAEQYTKQGYPPRRVFVDTGKIKDIDFMDIDYVPLLVNGRLIELKVERRDTKDKEVECHKVMDGGITLYESCNNVTPIEWLVNFFSHDGHWILEHDPNTVIIDGKSLNKKLGSSEVLDYHYVKDKLFYLFQDSEGKYRINFNMEIYPQKYDDIHGYECCSEGAFNPSGFDDYVSFYATKNGKWYYVEGSAE